VLYGVVWFSLEKRVVVKVMVDLGLGWAQQPVWSGPLYMCGYYMQADARGR